MFVVALILGSIVGVALLTAPDRILSLPPAMKLEILPSEDFKLDVGGVAVG